MSQKMMSRRSGPFIITKKLSSNRYVIKSTNADKPFEDEVHVSTLSPYHIRSPKCLQNTWKINDLTNNQQPTELAMTNGLAYGNQLNSGQNTKSANRQYTTGNSKGRQNSSVPAVLCESSSSESKVKHSYNLRSKKSKLDYNG